MITKIAIVCGFSLVAGAAQAQITFVGPVDLSGTGLGNTLNLLSVQSDPSEFGSILRSGGADVLGGDAKAQSQTRTVLELATQGVTAENLGLVFNISEPSSSPDVTINDFTLRFYTDNETDFFDLTWDGSLTLTQLSGGIGGAGYLFDVDLTAAQATAFFADPDNRIGMLITEGNSITDTAGGAENFFIVPTPGTAAVVLLGSVWGFRRRR